MNTSNAPRSLRSMSVLAGVMVTAGVASADLVGIIEPGGSYAGLQTISNAEITSSWLEILAGTNQQGRPVEVTASWRARDSSHFYEKGLQTDIVHLAGTGTDLYVLQLHYDESLIPEISGNDPTAEARWAADGDQCLHAWDPESLQWVRAVYLNRASGAGGAEPLRNFQGSWAASGHTMVLGSYGVDIDANTVWAVLNYEGTFAPEPGAFLMLLGGGVAMLRRRSRRHYDRSRSAT